MLVVANLSNRKNDAKKLKMTETLEYEYSSEKTQWELSNEYQHDKVKMFLKNLCVLVLTLDESSLSIRRVKIFRSYLISYGVNTWHKGNILIT